MIFISPNPGSTVVARKPQTV